jgi:hypothetical protein
MMSFSYKAGWFGAWSARGGTLIGVLIAVICLAGVVDASPSEDLTAGWALDLSWDTSQSARYVKLASAEDRLSLVCRLSGADSLQGFQVMLRIRAVGESPAGSWLFRDSLACGAATFEVDSRGDGGAAAPWTHKLVISDIRYGELSGAAVIIVAGAFDRAVLNPDSSYVLCNIDLTPPGMAVGDGSDAACGGWDSHAVCDIVAAEALLPGGRKLPLEVPRKCLALQLVRSD